MWKGIIAPFRREARGDFVTGEGIDAVAASIMQILGTRCSVPGVLGEIPWRPSFGSTLEYLRHKTLPVSILRDLARHATIDAIRKWEPRAMITSVEIEIRKDDVSRANIIEVSISFMLSNVTTFQRNAQPGNVTWSNAA